jgi:hypothetical protein
MKPKKRPACDLVFPRDKMRKGIVGNNRKAEMNVVKVKPQSRKNCEVNSGEFGVGEGSGAMGCLSGGLFCLIRDT